MVEAFVVVSGDPMVSGVDLELRRRSANPMRPLVGAGEARVVIPTFAGMAPPRKNFAGTLAGDHLVTSAARSVDKNRPRRTRVVACLGMVRIGRYRRRQSRMLAVDGELVHCSRGNCRGPDPTCL